MRLGIVLSSSVLVSALFIGVTEAPAFADPEAARQHFDRGKKLRDDGNCKEAIPEFEQSLTAEKSIGAYYNLGFCQEQLGKKQEAHDAYKRAQQLASAKKDDRLREISGALGSLLDSPHIRLALPQQLPEGTQIRVDDQLVPPQFYQPETVVFTKAGRSHVVVVTAPGYEERRETVENKQLKPIELRRAGESTPSAPATPVRTEQRGLTVNHLASFGAFAVGATLVSVSLGLTISYKIKSDNLFAMHQDATSCRPTCSQEENAEIEQRERAYYANEDDARDAAPLWVGLGIGGVLALGAGTLLLVTAPSMSDQVPVEKAESKPAFRAHIVPLLGRVQGLGLHGTF